MEEPKAGAPDAPAPASVPARTPSLPRWLAVLETIAVSGVPTQLLVVVVLFLTTDLGSAQETGNIIDRVMSLEFTAGYMLVDTALIAIMIRVFLEMSGEDSRAVFLGRRPVLREFIIGLLIVPLLYAGVAIIILGVRAVMPELQTVEKNPLEQYMQSPLEATIFAVVVILAGGIKEELQRGFILTRFEQRLGGAKIGLILYSLIFFVLHAYQGWDKAIGIGALGVFWGILYIRRGSAVMSMTSHAGFDALGVVGGALSRSTGS